ncbi:MAG: ornithine carbamoyltransferase [Candidatus Norongarragalinales archaeon]
MSELNRKKHFLTLLDWSESEVREMLRLALDLKAGRVRKSLSGKTLAMLFQKASTRTRVSFEAGMTRLGGHAIFLDFSTTQLGRGETIEDTARTLSRYCDVVMARLYKQSDLEALAAASSIPVINGLTELYHPCQTMADMLTVIEKKKEIDGLKVVFLGDCGFNMFHSTAIGFSKLGARVVGACPNGDYEPKPVVWAAAKKQAKHGAASLSIERDPVRVVKDADVVITDTWVSMGQDAEKEKRLRELAPYQLNSALLKHAKKDAIVLHCLPAHRGQEITDDVIDGRQSVVFDEAENRLHAQNAVIVKLLNV